MHAARFADEIPDTCLLLEHPPVYTAGRRTDDSERPLDGTPVMDVDRGGKITWHGPGQLVGYPILKLPRPVDVVAHVRRLEEALIRTCPSSAWRRAGWRAAAGCGCWATRWSAGRLGGLTLDFDPRLADEEFDPRLNGPEYAPSNAGQRREDRKLAAIGIRVAKGVTMHGFALNCNPDNTWFDRIVPCGIRDAGVTSLSASWAARSPSPRCCRWSRSTCRGLTTRWRSPARCDGRTAAVGRTGARAPAGPARSRTPERGNAPPSLLVGSMRNHMKHGRTLVFTEESKS